VDVNDADHLAHDPATRRIIGGRGVRDGAASASQMGGFETKKRRSGVAPFLGFQPVELIELKVSRSMFALEKLFSLRSR